MKIFIPVILALIIFSSCTQGKKERLIGTWCSVSEEKSNGASDSIQLHYFIQFTADEGIYYLNQLTDGNWYFFKGYSMDSIHYETIKFSSDDKFEIVFPDSVRKKLGISKKTVYNRVEKNIKPGRIILDLYNEILPLGTALEIDTLADRSIYYSCWLIGKKEKSISAMENQVKFFFDKEMKSPPEKEELNKYDRTSGNIMNRYTWEDMNSKILMECYFNFGNTTDKDKSNDFDRLKVKIWQVIK
jgi:bifunctional DNA-binding transcriptional regulator/antitoxin component of YhaV-PrlF toxin-antitoxin module